MEGSARWAGGCRRRASVAGAVLICAFTISCGGSTSSASTTTPTAFGSSSALPSSGTESPTPPGGVADPCTLVTQHEASILTGISQSTCQPGNFPIPGTSSLATGYGFQRNWAKMNMLLVWVVPPEQSRNATTTGLVQAPLRGLLGGFAEITYTPVSDLPDADAALIARATAMQSDNGGASQLTISGAGIAVLKGQTFLILTDLVEGHQAASDAALEAQARISLGRIP